jgi:hypothetical protein
VELKNRSGIFFTIIFLAFAAVVYTFFINDRPLTLTERAEERALLLARKLIDSEFVLKVYLPDQSKVKSEPERNLASQDNDTFEMTKKVSDGAIGRDPWGGAFHFQLKGDGKAGSKLFIWSHGENGQPDFKKVEDMINSGYASGDDILVSLSI